MDFISTKPRLAIQLLVLSYVDHNGTGDLVSVPILAVIVDEFSVRIHQIHNNCVIHDVVVILVSGSRTEVDPECFTHLLNLINGSSKA